MRFSILTKNKRALARSAMIFIAAGTMAGCSAQATRFGGGIDDLFTASTPNQRQIIRQEQPYPGDMQVAAAPVERAQTTPVSRNSLPPVSSQPLPPANNAAPALAPVASAASSRPALAPVADAAPRLDHTATGTVSPAVQPAMASLESDPEGWSRAGGTQVTAKAGETVYNLSRRFGVPANVLMKVNGLSEQSGLQAGQKVIIPTYVYSAKAPVSAPDSNPNVADAKSSTGTRYDVPAHQVPVPASAPAANAAALPQAADRKPVAQGSAAPGSYKVEAGDTLTRIASKTGVSVAALKSANGLQDGAIRIGQTLQIPAQGATAVAATVSDPVVTGATGPAQPAKQTQPPQAEKVASYTPPKKATKAIEEAEAENVAAAPNSTGIDRMRWPVRGRIISAYGKGGGKSNDGIDIQVPEGTPVKAAENGVVIYAGDGLKEFGNTVLVRHENGLVTVYGHASELKVARGEKVRRGQEIALSGMSGSTESPKLHFEIRKDSSPVNPATYLE